MAVFGMVKSGSMASGDFSILQSFIASNQYATSHTITNLKGKKVIAMLFTIGSSAQSNTLFDGATVSDGSTIRKFGNLLDRSANATATFYQIDVKTDSCTVSHTSSNYMQVLG